LAVALASLVCLGCSGSLPRPERVQVTVADYVAVSRIPREPLVEVVPPQPQKGTVWVDGTWEVAQDRFRWRPGAWVYPPAADARYARWVIVRRKEDGQLFFAPSHWRNKAGRLPDPTPLVQAHNRTGPVHDDE
jgi:hypothetical protein